ncbi:MAG: hypothetical protein NZM06_05200 [Chloroherpetonaceae bacterium]|nr:hypothetical protein [Chloroherpetonaceae bacterium]MDW8437931.1 hypothetical protein [Chloroherpetonaceae bacterium]
MNLKTSKIIALITLSLLTTNAFSMPLVCAESDALSIEVVAELTSTPEDEESNDDRSAELEERQEELAILSVSTPLNAENQTRFFSSSSSRTLVGVSDELIIPPNA